jgi:predicted esterase
MIFGITVALLASGVLHSQPPSGTALPQGQNLDSPILSKAVQKLQGSAKAELKAEVARWLAESKSLQAEGKTGEARRQLAHAYVALQGQTWDDKQAFVWSLVLRNDKLLADSSEPVTGALAQVYSAPYKSTKGLRLKLALFPEKTGTVVLRALGIHDLPARDYVENPALYSVNVHGVPDGTYRLTASVVDGDETLATLEKTIRLIRNLDVNAALFENRLEKIAGHYSTKAAIRYPFDLARVVNIGKRGLGSADFGVGSPPFDFAKGMQRSAELLAALEAGRDPLWRAKGDTTRGYWFEEAQEILPYRVYCPTTWDGKSKLPLLVVLHGNTRDHDFYFDRDEGILGKTAEKNGWLIVTPLGYHPNGGYGAGLAKAGKGMNAAARRRQELSEKDALNVVELVSKEYDIDPSRTYLFGHSSGGTGTWHLAQKYPERWAGIGISAGLVTPATYAFDKLKDKAIVMFHGDLDNEVKVTSSRNMDKALKERNIPHEYFEFKGATHATVVALAIPKLFEYFDLHRKK